VLTRTLLIKALFTLVRGILNSTVIQAVKTIVIIQLLRLVSEIKLLALRGLMLVRKTIKRMSSCTKSSSCFDFNFLILMRLIKGFRSD
jgi:hypothetical protein